MQSTVLQRYLKTNPCSKNALAKQILGCLFSQTQGKVVALNLSRRCLTILAFFALFIAANAVAALADSIDEIEGCIISYEGSNFLGLAKQKTLHTLAPENEGGSIVLQNPILQCSGVGVATAQLVEISNDDVTNPSDVIRFHERNTFAAPIVRDDLTFYPVLNYLTRSGRPKMTIGFLCISFLSEFFTETSQDIDICSINETPLLFDRLPVRPPGSEQCKVRLMFKSSGRFMQVVSRASSMKCSDVGQEELIEQASNILRFFEYVD